GSSVASGTMLARLTVAARPREADDIDRILPRVDSTVREQHLRTHDRDVSAVYPFQESLETVFVRNRVGIEKEQPFAERFPRGEVDGTRVAKVNPWVQNPY